MSDSTRSGFTRRWKEGLEQFRDAVAGYLSNQAPAFAEWQKNNWPQIASLNAKFSIFMTLCMFSTDRIFFSTQHANDYAIFRLVMLIVFLGQVFCLPALLQKIGVQRRSQKTILLLVAPGTWSLFYQYFYWQCVFDSGFAINYHIVLAGISLAVLFATLCLYLFPVEQTILVLVSMPVSISIGILGQLQGGPPFASAAILIAIGHTAAWLFSIPVRKIFEQRCDLADKELRLTNALRSTMDRVFHDVQKPYYQFELVLKSLQKAREMEDMQKGIDRFLPIMRGHMTSVNRMLLDLSDISSEVRLSAAPTSLGLLLRECLLETMKFEAGARKAAFTYIYNLGHQRQLQVDREKAKRIINNILRNIWEATATSKSTEEVTFTSKDDKHFLHLTITNTGSSIPAERQGAAFTTFYTRGSTSGRGIGLSIVRKFTEMHGGHCWIESSELSNTFSMNIYLPVSSVEDDFKADLPASSAELLLLS